MSELYYYTDFETFKTIMNNGTLRFKESTKSNDKLDTNILYEELKELFNERYGEDASKNAQIQFLTSFFENKGYQNNSFPVVACFTEKADSRLLWDAYTMHRKDRESKRYNGVCIQINIEKLAKAMQKECDENDLFIIRSILYEKCERKKFLEKKLDEFDKSVEELSKDSNQEQNIIPEKRFILPSGRRGIDIKLKKCIVFHMIKFLNELQILSPLFKHEFWNEEMETRALFCKQENGLGKLSDGAYFYDVHIQNDVFEKAILGPEFSNEDMKVLQAQDNTIDISKIQFVHSNGMGVITSQN